MILAQQKILDPKIVETPEVKDIKIEREKVEENKRQTMNILGKGGLNS
jgi:hypothetical protein